MKYSSTQFKKRTSISWTLRIQGEQIQYTSDALYTALLEGQISVDTACLHGKEWIALRDVPDLQFVHHDPSLAIAHRLRSKNIPWLSLFCGLLLVLGDWLQTEQLVLLAANGWSNVFLEDRWWSILGSVFLHGSKVHFISNLLLILFFGWCVEKSLGVYRTGVLMISGIIGSSFFSWFFDASIPFIGASAVVFALWAAQITIGIVFRIPKTFRFWYGWWGLIFLLMVLGLQLFLEGISHSVHIGGLVTGCFFVVLYRFGYPFSVCVSLLSLLFICLLGGIDCWSKRDVSVDGLRFFIPNDFVAIETQGVVFWFHRNQPTGYILSAWEEGERKDVLKWWNDKGFSSQEKPCPPTGGCSLFSESEEVYLEFEKYGQYTRWIGCVYPKDNTRWHTYCALWIEQRTRQEPNALRTARIQYENSKNQIYTIQQYANQAERYGEYQLADDLYEELLQLDWREQSFEHRKRLRKQGFLPWEQTFLEQIEGLPLNSK